MLAEKCQWCNQEKLPLPNETDKKGLPVFVCATIPEGSKQKIPCDGNVYKYATKKT